MAVSVGLNGRSVSTVVKPHSTADGNRGGPGCTEVELID